jgi:hypothetical protein
VNEVDPEALRHRREDWEQDHQERGRVEEATAADQAQHVHERQECVFLLRVCSARLVAGPSVCGGAGNCQGPYGQFAGLNNWPFGAALAFVLMAATLALPLASNVLVQRHSHR